VLAGIIVTHGDLARALRAAAASIAGDIARVEVVSNDGLTAEALLAEVRAALDRVGGEAGTVVFADLSGGSCATACQLALAGEHVRLVTGVNLPMLVDFVLRRGDLELDAMVARLLQRGRSSIQELRPT
jgi:mannose/fructose-specific phosphotransferase system component IIA